MIWPALVNSALFNTFHNARYGKTDLHVSRQGFSSLPWPAVLSGIGFQEFFHRIGHVQLDILDCSDQRRHKLFVRNSIQLRHECGDFVWYDIFCRQSACYASMLFPCQLEVLTQPFASSGGLNN